MDHIFSSTDPDGPCTDECVAAHPDHADTRGEDAYWVVTLDRGTGAVTATLIEDADDAHRQAETLACYSVFTTVVGKR